MKALTSLAAAAACLVLGASCGDKGVSAGELAGKVKNAAESVDFDVSKLSSEELTGKMTELSGSVVEKLGSITDIDSAKDAVGMLGPIVEKMGSMKTMLGDKMPDLGALKTAAEGLASKFGGDEGIMGVLKPVLDKIMAMFA